MARYYSGAIVRPHHRRCQRCGRRSMLFGDRDTETGWIGWCSVCNADWRAHEIEGRCRCCSRGCNIASPALCGMGVYIPHDVAIQINSYLFVESRILHQVTMRTHRRALQLLEWTSARLDWYLADDSSEELEPEASLPGIRHVCLRRHPGSFERSCFHDLDRRRTLLDAIYTYLTPSKEITHEQQLHGWDMFLWQGRFWLWQNSTEEWFFIDKPPSCWRRYYCFAAFPRTASTIVCWWHNASLRRWFVEPRFLVVQRAVYDGMTKVS